MASRIRSLTHTLQVMWGWSVVARRGRVLDRWELLSARFVADEAQTRAVRILDLVFDRLNAHRSGKDWVGLERKLPVIFAQATADSHADMVAAFTKKLAAENKALLVRQRGVVDPKVQSGDAPARAELSKEVRQESLPVGGSLPPKEVREESPPTAPTAPTTPAGLYLFGSVGRGKTLLMDLLVGELGNPRVRRLHFFDLMKLVHAEMVHSADLGVVANKLADTVDVLCIDELVIGDIQDATIFPHVLGVLVSRGVALIFTSNQHPQSLYLGGLNRHVYLPGLLEGLRRGCRLVSLNGPGGDFRRVSESGWRFTKLEASGAIDVSPQVAPQPTISDSNFIPQVSTPSTPSTRSQILIPLSPTRTLQIGLAPQSNLHSLHAHVDELIDRDLSEADFAAVADFLVHRDLGLHLTLTTPFSPEDILGKARRFAKLVEVLYDRGVLVEIFSEIEIDEIFSKIAPSHALKQKGVLGDTADAVASPLAASAVDEALRGLERSLSRLRQADSRFRS